MFCSGESIWFNRNIHLYSRICISIFTALSLILDSDVVFSLNNILSMHDFGVLVILIGFFVTLSFCLGFSLLFLMATEQLQYSVMGPRFFLVCARNRLHSRCTIVVVTLWSLIHILQLGFSFILSLYFKRKGRYVYTPGAELFQSLGDSSSDGVVAAMGMEIILVVGVIASFFTWLASREVLEEDYTPLEDPEDDPPPSYISVIQPEEPYLPKYDDIFPMQPVGNI